MRGTALWHSDCVITTLGGRQPGAARRVDHHDGARRTPTTCARPNASRPPTPGPPGTTGGTRLMPHNLRTSTIGIVGYGRIGKEVARIARALGMDVLALRRGSSDGSSDRSSDRSSDGSSGGATSAPPTEQRFGASGEVEGVTELPASQLHDLLTRSDYVALTVPLTPQTEGMIGRGRDRRDEADRGARQRQSGRRRRRSCPPRRPRTRPPRPCLERRLRRRAAARPTTRSGRTSASSSRRTSPASRPTTSTSSARSFTDNLGRYLARRAAAQRRRPRKGLLMLPVQRHAETLGLITRRGVVSVEDLAGAPRR